MSGNDGAIRMRDMRATLNGLPTELKLIILEWLLRMDPVSLLRMIGVNKQFQALAPLVQGKSDLRVALKSISDTFDSGHKPPEERLFKMFEQSLYRFQRVQLKLKEPRLLVPNSFGMLKLVNPLHVAAQYGLVRVADKLLRGGGADIDGVEPYTSVNDTPLTLACRREHADIVELLLENGAKVDKATKQGETPLILACSASNYEIAKLLLEYGADANKEDNDGNSPLGTACFSHAIELQKLLLAHNATVTAEILYDTEGDTPAILLAAADEKEKLLADALELCFRRDVFSQRVEGLLKAGVEIELGKPLWDVAGSNVDRRLAYVKVLLAHDAEVDFEFEHKTPLLRAIDSGEKTLRTLKICERLVDAGADLTRKDELGRTAYDIAKERGFALINDIGFLNTAGRGGAKGLVVPASERAVGGQ